MNDFKSSQSLNRELADGDALSEVAFNDGHLDGHVDGKSDVKILTLCVTDQDYYWSDRSGLRNPILCALQRATRTLWRLYDDGFALEAMPPYRFCQLPPASMKEWQRWLVMGEMESPEWEIELFANPGTGCLRLDSATADQFAYKALPSNLFSG